MFFETFLACATFIDLVSIPKGFKKIAGGKRSATTGPVPNDRVSRRDYRNRFLASLRDAWASGGSFPVVALHLPPAIVSNPSGMKAKATGIRQQFALRRYTLTSKLQRISARKVHVNRGTCG
jgi:hypothetical protein